jgi:hypothetical protein
MLSIDLKDFVRLQSMTFDATKSLYFPAPESILSGHPNKEHILNLIRAATLDPRTEKATYNPNNIFNIQVDENGHPSAIYGFTVGLNAKGKPCLMFGNPYNDKEVSNEVEIVPFRNTEHQDYEEDDDTEFQALNNPRVKIDFIANPKVNSANPTPVVASLYMKKGFRIRCRVLLAEGTTADALNRVSTTEEFASLLAGVKKSSYTYGLKDLSNPKVLEFVKGLPANETYSFPLELEVTSFEEKFTLQSGAICRTLNIREISGKKIYGYSVYKGEERIDEVTKVVIYPNMTAGYCCDDSGAALMLACQMCGGKVILRLTKPGSEAKFHPKHVLTRVPSSDPVLAAAFEWAQDQVFTAIEKNADLNQVIASITAYLQSRKTVATLAPTKEVQVATPVKSVVVNAPAVQLKSAEVDLYATYDQQFEDDDEPLAAF